MRAYYLRDGYTPARLARLQECAAAGEAGAPRHAGRTGYDCMRLGFTEWVDVRALDSRERLTDKGLARLMEWSEVYGNVNTQSA